MAVGPGMVDEEGNVQPMNVRVGDRVLFSAYAGSEAKTDDAADYLIVSEDDILGVLA